MPQDTIGIDVSKDQLDVCRLPEGQRARFDNTAVGYRNLVAWMGEGVARVVFEPTGPYHGALEQALSRQGIPLVKINPRQARRFAEGIGQTAKTDRLDAELLARMGMMLRIEPRPAQTQALWELKELHQARAALVKERTAVRNRQEGIHLPLLKRLNADHLRQITHQLVKVEAEIERRIRADTDLSRRFDILLSIPGIARLSAFTLLIEMPELGSMKAPQVAALTGLAPLVRQSGHWAGHAFIRGGRAPVRRALYMPALVAVRYNPGLKAKYERFLADGKPFKLAITAVMRNLIVLANALLKADRPWSPIPA